MEKILMFTKEQWLAVFQFCAFAFSVAGVLYGILHKKIKQFFDMREKFYITLNGRFEKVYGAIELNNVGTKALLFAQIDKMLTSSERYNNIVGSQLYSQLKQFIELYIKMGDGIDGGETFKQRFNNLTVDDVKFHELQNKINSEKHKIIEEE